VPNSNEALQGVDPRNAFVPSKKGTRMLFSCDYSQKEVRILAHMCSDKALMSLFLDKSHDIYKQMASLIRNKPLESVTSEERSQFKQVTLAILYGMSPKQVAKKLNISETAAVQIMRDFFHKFSGLKKVPRSFA
jgi:DNA polymerase-1